VVVTRAARGDRAATGGAGERLHGRARAGGDRVDLLRARQAAAAVRRVGVEAELGRVEDAVAVLVLVGAAGVAGLGGRPDVAGADLGAEAAAERAERAATDVAGAAGADGAGLTAGAVGV